MRHFRSILRRETGRHSESLMKRIYGLSECIADYINFCVNALSQQGLPIVHSTMDTNAILNAKKRDF